MNKWDKFGTILRVHTEKESLQKTGTKDGVPKTSSHMKCGWYFWTNYVKEINYNLDPCTHAQLKMDNVKVENWENECLSRLCNVKTK